MENMVFGDYIKAKRMDCEITLRELSKSIGVSTAYLSDVENNRRYPMGKIEVVKKLIRELKLNEKEKEIFYDLAGKARKEVSPDLPEYIMDSDVAPLVRTALRTAKEVDATEEDWKRIIDGLAEKGKE